jgi:3-oxoacyl-[acyl-carrier-protein] synthase II
MGSTTGSPETFEQYFRKFIERKGPGGQLSTSFFKIMNHSIASNVAVGLNYNGPQLAVASACSTSTQAIVAAWELIRAGIYDVVVAGGADELHHTSAAIFDNVHAASFGHNDRPEATPRPFDRDRDGLVVGEGAGMVVMESARHALQRGARPLAKVLAGSYYCNGTHMTQPQVEGMVDTMRMAIERARMTPAQIDYICAHGTGTLMGDVQEARATYEVVGGNTPVSSLKGHLGHTLAACGSIEAIASVAMLNEGVIFPTRNLENIDPEVACIKHVTSVVKAPIKTVLSNNFAFGGMNATIILSKWED